MDISEEPIQFILSPPMLQTLASQELALIICRDIARNDIKADFHHGWNMFNCTCRKLAPKIQGVPSLLKKMIKNCLWKLVVKAPSFTEWCSYHRNSVFYDVPYAYFHNAVLNCIDEFVLNPYGEISYLQTAKNILNSGKLNQVEKFKLACINCLVDDIEHLWPSVSDNFKVLDERVLYVPPLVGYWTDVMKGKFERVSVENPHLIDNKWGLEILKKSESTAVEYFWNFLSADEQVAAAEVLLSKNCDNSKRHHRLFLRCSDDQLISILPYCVDGSLLSPFSARGLNYYEWMLASWNRLKRLITPDAFAAVVVACIEQGFHFTTDQIGYADSILFEMWTSAPDHFRNYILYDKKKIESIFEKLKPFLMWSLSGIEIPSFRPCRFSMEFFIAVLTSIDFSQRSYLWRQFWSSIIVHSNLQGLQNIMRLCLSNENEINQFKKRNMLNLEMINIFLTVLIEDGRFSMLAEYLDFCSSEKQRVVNLKQEILRLDSVKSDIAIYINLWGEKKLANFRNFVNDAFSNEEDAEEYVRSFSSKKSKKFKSSWEF